MPMAPPKNGCIVAVALDPLGGEERTTAWPTVSAGGVAELDTMFLPLEGSELVGQAG